ncbi:hypothetical protein BDN72DRAFT_775416, partial [Pluteus cervinus]
MYTSEESVALIDAKVRSLEDQIRQLYTQRNDFMPISALPPEILTSIVKKALHHEFRVGSRLVTLSRVSRTWRETITTCKPLWTCIDTGNAQFIAICLERSHPLPILA